MLDRDDYSVSAHSSDGGSESGTDAGSVAPDEPFLNMVRKTKKRGLAQDLAKFDGNYCGLCGTVHTDTCHMVQNADNLVEYRAMLMEVTNEEPIEMRVSGPSRGSFSPVLISCEARSGPGYR